jgi:hypothetical protein
MQGRVSQVPKKEGKASGAAASNDKQKDTQGME